VSAPDGLPRLKDVFRELRRGRHICADDGPLHRALREHHRAFAELFEQLGFRFERHPRGFFYFCGEEALSETARRLSVFMFVLIEWLGDQGQSIGDALETGTYALARLPHLTHPRYAAYMREAGVTDDTALAALVARLERLGFAQRLNADEFRFRSPVYRFLDLCEEITAEEDDA